MCDPISIGSAAVSGLGSLISGSEANANARAQQDARNAATMAELERQKRYGAQSRGEFDKSMALYAPGAQDASLAKSQGDVGTILTNNAPTADMVGSITTAGAPKVVGATEQSKLGDVFTRIAQSNKNLGALKGYDQNTLANKVALNNTGRNIDVYGDFSKTSAGVNRMEQNAAATNATKPSSGIGELLSFGGNLGSYYGGAGKIGLPKFGGSTTLPSSALTATGALY